MSFYQNSSTPSRRFRLVQASFLQEDGLVFAQVLPEEQIDKAFTDAHADFARGEGAVYAPAVTL